MLPPAPGLAAVPVAAERDAAALAAVLVGTCISVTVSPRGALPCTSTTTRSAPPAQSRSVPLTEPCSAVPRSGPSVITVVARHPLHRPAVRVRTRTGGAVPCQVTPTRSKPEVRSGRPSRSAVSGTSRAETPSADGASRIGVVRSGPGRAVASSVSVGIARTLTTIVVSSGSRIPQNVISNTMRHLSHRRKASARQSKSRSPVRERLSSKK